MTQIRLMGEPKTVRAIAMQMERLGIMTITGEAPNRGDTGLRVYGTARLVKSNEAAATPRRLE